jgi:tetratricopeptide (TPR) repeat protein
MHPNTALSLNNLALLYHIQGKYEDAEPLYQRAIKIFEQAWGNAHSDTATSLSNLANLYYRQKKYEDAELWSRRALSSYEQVWGVEHPYTQELQQTYAALLRALGRDADDEQENTTRS